MKKSKFYGLRGTSLNVAIAVIAGTDFALFGYGTFFPGTTPLMGILFKAQLTRSQPQIRQVTTALCLHRAQLTANPGCVGWSADTALVPPLLPPD